MAKSKPIWFCTSCGMEAVKWGGKCSGCGEWNTMKESEKVTGKPVKGSMTAISGSFSAKAQRLADIDDELYEGFPSGMKELDRVFGGKVVKGSVTLLAGEPGKGKSTLLSQLSSYVSSHVGPVLYTSGEESVGQGKKRIVERMKLNADNLYLLHTKDLRIIEQNILDIRPSLAIVDSIQMVGDPDISSAVGSVSQINACTGVLIELAKTTGCAVIIVGHVTKDNAIGGPRQLEHMVDTVLYLEGEQHHDLRLVRVTKNRFGSTDELGVFQMRERGMEEVSDPSEFMLADRLHHASGSAVVCISDSRPLLVEVQALVSKPIVQGTFPKRRAHGFDIKRLDIVLSVLEKVLHKHKLAYKDVILNIAGGMRIEEPGADLGVAMAIYSSEINVPIDQANHTKTLILGEIGLVGEVRPVANVERLVKEGERAGFTRCLLPKKSAAIARTLVKTMQLEPIETVEEAIFTLFER